MNQNKFDFIIIGAGLAGLYAALNATKYGTVALITKTTLEVSNSYLAQGGIAASIAEDDSPALHVDDTLKTGRGLCYHDAVDILINEGRQIIQSLIEQGMMFDNLNGKISLGLEGGHSKRRVLHAGGDSTGKELVNFLVPLVQKEKNIKLFENIFVYELINHEASCKGIRCFDLDRQTSFNIVGRSTIIASGGASAIYSRTTNPSSSVGEGIYLAYNIGAEIESMEFIQFHPTVFYSEHGETFLISEAVRGEGAYLVNHEGKRFLTESNYTELSPRDVVSEAVFSEIQRSGKPNVFLKLDHLDPLMIRKRFKNIIDEAQKNNIDITKDLVPVAPAAHYTVGGIKTGLNGETNISGLYAIGEAASTGVHGANRLASNSLLECLVFAKRTIEYSVLNPTSSLPCNINNQKFRIDERNREKFQLIRESIGIILWENAGIIKSKSGLASVLHKLSKIENSINIEDDEYYGYKIRSLLSVAGMIIQSAIVREESRGCHKRSDFPAENPDMLKTIVLKKGNGPRFCELLNTLDRKCG